MIVQKFSNGFWIGLTVKTFPKCLSKFYFVPLAFVLSLIVCTLLCFCGFPLLLTLLLTCYASFDLYLTFNAFKRKERRKHFILLPFIFPLLHISYGAGTLAGLIHLPIRKDKLNKAKRKIKQVKMYYLGN